MKQKKDIAMVGIFACLLFTTYVSFSYIVTYIYENESSEVKFMGPLILISSFFVFFVTNSFAPGFKIKIKNQLLIAAVSYTINYAV